MPRIVGPADARAEVPALLIDTRRRAHGRAPFPPQEHPASAQDVSRADGGDGSKAMLPAEHPGPSGIQLSQSKETEACVLFLVCSTRGIKPRPP